MQWVVGDAAELPFDDDTFDVVTSTFGHMFAPDHAASAGELARVCRPGSTVGLCCWTPEGKFGQMFARLGSHMPRPTEGFQSPLLWARSRTCAHCWSRSASPSNCIASTSS